MVTYKSEPGKEDCSWQCFNLVLFTISCPCIFLPGSYVSGPTSCLWFLDTSVWHSSKLSVWFTELWLPKWFSTLVLFFCFGTTSLHSIYRKPQLQLPSGGTLLSEYPCSFLGIFRVKHNEPIMEFWHCVRHLVKHLYKTEFFDTIGKKWQ